ncbi:hypothetical protein E0H73_18890 [Kribbella pittospori]|uniref:LPXTG cell wall anchor domain-containing protein n=1 Tax=Kribbella pittospori TaxID=722689 RepID=A0A4V2MB03_9ACTN|nr:hypothetical protein [Kribbella pittospori]TCC61302.1 hypothetical protein E0H73_18890 [Kribbella pittospori]
MKHRSIAIAVVLFGIALGTAAPATASPWEPNRTQTQQVDPWPDEGTGYPGYADPTPAPAPPESVGRTTALDTNSVALGALGGISLGAVALGVTLIVLRRRDQHGLSES